MYANIIILFCLIILINGTPAPDLDRYRAPLTQQNIQTSLMAIEEMLSSLTKIYSLRYSTPRWELSIETQNRKLETLETKISRIETLLDLRLEKISENLSSKTIKQERFIDQMSRKIDNTYERLNHRINYMESRLENTIVKLQHNMDQSLTKINNQLEHFEKTTSEIENDVLELSISLDETKSILVNSSSSACENKTENKLKLMERDLESYTDIITKLNNNMSSEMRKNEEMIRKSLDLVNVTRRELQDGIKSIKGSRRHTCPTLEDDYLIDIVNSIQSLGRKTEGNHQRLENNLASLHMQQNLFLDSCHRIQQDEPQLEKKISDILVKMLESIKNRTELTDKNYDTLNEMLKSHHSHMIRTVSHTTNSVLKLNEQVDKSLKSAVPNIQTTEKIDIILTHILELQDQIQEMNITDKNPYVDKLSTLTNSVPIINMISDEMKNISSQIEELKNICTATESFQLENTLEEEDEYDDDKQNKTKIEDILNIFGKKEDTQVEESQDIRDGITEHTNTQNDSSYEGTKFIDRNDKTIENYDINDDNVMNSTPVQLLIDRLVGYDMKKKN